MVANPLAVADNVVPPLPTTKLYSFAANGSDPRVIVPPLATVSDPLPVCPTVSSAGVPVKILDTPTMIEPGSATLPSPTTHCAPFCTVTWPYAPLRTPSIA